MAEQEQKNDQSNQPPDLQLSPPAEKKETKHLTPEQTKKELGKAR